MVSKLLKVPDKSAMIYSLSLSSSIGLEQARPKGKVGGSSPPRAANTDGSVAERFSGGLLIRVNVGSIPTRSAKDCPRRSMVRTFAR